MPTTMWYNTPGEWEQVDDNGFVYKRRKREVPPEKSHSAAANPLHHHSEVNHKAVPNPALERRKRKQVLLAAKAMYAAELEAWEKLAAATSSAPSHSQAPISPIVSKESPHDELLQQLSIEVTEMEEYIKQLQIIRNEGEATYQVLIRNMVKEMSKPAANLIHALSFQPTNVATDFFQYSDQALHEPSASFTESTNQ